MSMSWRPHKTKTARKIITLQEWADYIGVSKNTMNLIESSKPPDPAASKVKAIADVLQVRADYLLGREEEASELLAAAVA